MPRISTEERLARVQGRYDELLAEIAQVGYIASGSLAPRYSRCGKTNCRCHGDEPKLHGPYWHWTAKVDGKTVNRRLSDAEAAIYQEWIGNDRRLRALVEELRTVAHEALEFKLTQARDDMKV
jgi:hypothetical protein